MGNFKPRYYGSQVVPSSNHSWIGSCKERFFISKHWRQGFNILLNNLVLFLTFAPFREGPTHQLIISLNFRGFEVCHAGLDMPTRQQSHDPIMETRESHNETPRPREPITGHERFWKLLSGTNFFTRSFFLTSRTPSLNCVYKTQAVLFFRPEHI